MVEILEYSSPLLPRLQILTLKFLRFLLRPLRYRGFGRLTEFLSYKVFGGDNYVIVKVHQSSRFKIYLKDHYWFLLLCRGYEYEGELKNVLSQILSEECAFIDCGANKGYWSLMAAERIKPPKHVISLEASGGTFALIEENAQMNPNPFVRIQKAIDSQAGKIVEFLTYGDNHAGAFLKGAKAERQGARLHSEKVETTTLDEIYLTYLKDFQKLIVVKLDVEGNEINALKGASQLLLRDVLVIYEDLGLSSDEDISRFVMEELKLEVYFSDVTDKIIHLRSFKDVQNIRILNTRMALNFFACTSGGSASHFFQGK